MWKNPAPSQQKPLLKHKKALGQEPGILWWQSHGNMAHKQPKLCHAASSSCDSLPDLAVDFRYLWGWLCGCPQPDLGDGDEMMAKDHGGNEHLHPQPCQLPLQDPLKSGSGKNSWIEGMKSGKCPATFSWEWGGWHKPFPYSMWNEVIPKLHADRHLLPLIFLIR